MSNLCERLKEFMQEQELNQSGLGKVVGIPRANISNYLLGLSLPSFKHFVKLLHYFNCSADYLLGKTDLHTEEKLLTVPVFKDQFRRILKFFNVSQEQLKRDLNFSGSMLYKWISGKNQPSCESLIRLAKYFECSVDFLIGRIR